MMHQLHLLLVLASVALSTLVLSQELTPEQEQRHANLRQNLNQMKADIQAYKQQKRNRVGNLARQVMRQWLDMEERTRSILSSGIRAQRAGTIGTRSFHTGAFTNNAVNALHNHNQNDATVGMGEVAVVINGVHFRTRHNDYSLSGPSLDSSEYGAREALVRPDVPPEVLAHDNVVDQMAEMREWFKAWRDQDYSVRDYRNYFKTAVCYMQGAWTLSEETVEEPFASDRHFVDATTWWDLAQKIRYTGASGSKDTFENLTFLPMKIAYLNNNDTEPVYAQWNFKINCGYVQDIPTSYFRDVDNLTYRAVRRTQPWKFSRSRQARFFPHDSENVEECNQGYCYLDSIMEQLPGADNWQGSITDPSVLDRNGQPLNQAYYHRYYRSNEKDATGSYERRRGYKDDFLYMARTTSERIAPTKVGDTVERWTYAIPLEVVYLTPLYKWNPYNHTHYDDVTHNIRVAVEGPRKNRNGGCSDEDAYIGTHRKVFYQTPMSFYTGAPDNETDEADTGKDNKCVLDQNGVYHMCAPSGTRISTFDIDGVGILRTRYPITAGADEGSVTHKEVLALREIMMHADTHSNMLHVYPMSADRVD